LLFETGLGHLAEPIEARLAKLEQVLENRLLEVNKQLATGDNPFVQLKNQGREQRWTFQQASAKEEVNHPFFKQLKQLDMSTVVHFVNDRCQFFKAFDHLLGRFQKTIAKDHVLVAALTAWGSNMGLGRMSGISDISYQELVTTSQNFLRSETLKEANDLISNAIKALPIFEYFSLDNQLHSSSDGQKFETSLHTIRSRYSPKYFGLKKGIVDYSTHVNYIPVNASIITANEHESHFVLDALLNNSSQVKPDLHSTDSHGSNEVNFALLDIFGYQFAPRYKDVHQQLSSNLYSFKHPSHYGDLSLKPVRKLSKDLIIDEWENLQRIFLSLALKSTSQHIIVGKLSRTVRSNKTQRALWEYDNIFKSLYLLDFVDSQTLRRNVGIVLNRGESYHRLRKAISFANYGKLRFPTEEEQQLWADCGRLLCNCIIFYNASILSTCLQSLQSSGQQDAIQELIKISPIAWTHVNFYGRYTFSRTPQLVNLHDMADVIQQNLLKQLAQIEH
jgi:TnpA family transposase